MWMDLEVWKWMQVDKLYVAEMERSKTKTQVKQVFGIIGYYQ